MPSPEQNHLHLEELNTTAGEELTKRRKKAKSKAEQLRIYRSFFKKQREQIRKAHDAGAGGIEIAEWRSDLLDVVINDIYALALEETDAAEKTGTPHPTTLIASGGYGRGQLNPGSDIDLQFLIPGNSDLPSKPVEEMVGCISTMLFDLGFEVSYPVRCIKGATRFANKDHRTKTTLLDARFIAGDGTFFDGFEEAFFKNCLRKQESDYLAQRSRDIRSRHKKYRKTIHLQEPNVKEGCGGLRDYHNLIWVIWVLEKSRDLRRVVKEGRLTEESYREIEEAFEFLMRVRNGLHYCQKGSPGDILTLRLQGIIATKFKYPGKNIIRRSEDFMRDYYRHTRNLFQYSTSLMQSFELEVTGEETGPIPIFNILARRANSAKEEHFDGFYSKSGLMFPENEDIFEEDPKRMMRCFLHLQSRHLGNSPPIRHLFKKSLKKINARFRASKSNRETLESMLNNRGQVAAVLRQMHRVGFLGKYLPEFGQLTDLVQHEFFHRYSADEHTLRCIDILDKLVHSDDPKEQYFKKIFQDLEDPVALYIALLMHDTGRAENVRHHEDASAMLASQVCQRLKYRGDRLRLIIFLVDHHLSFFRTATTKDLMDPTTIAEFASTVKNRTAMDALYLFTYVDSKGTNEEAWTDWKASLMQQLYKSTRSYFENREVFEKKFHRPVTETKLKVIDKLPKNYLEEIEAHFSAMPDRYFLHRGSTSIARHVKIFHQFFKKAKRSNLDGLIPVTRWEARTDEGYSLVEVAGWNRHHLAAKVAGTLAVRNLNILSADLFTREDDLALGIFRVCTMNFSPVTSQPEIKQIESLLAEEFGVGDQEVDFQKLIAKQAKPSILQSEDPLDLEVPQRVFFSNNLSPNATVMELQAKDRIGLLYDIFTLIGNHDMEILNARISTQAGVAIDRIALVDTNSEQKIEDPERLKKIEQAVAECICLEEKG